MSNFRDFHTCQFSFHSLAPLCPRVTHSPGHMRSPCVSSQRWTASTSLPALAAVSLLPQVSQPSLKHLLASAAGSGCGKGLVVGREAARHGGQPPGALTPSPPSSAVAVSCTPLLGRDHDQRQRLRAHTTILGTDVLARSQSRVWRVSRVDEIPFRPFPVLCGISSEAGDPGAWFSVPCLAVGIGFWGAGKRLSFAITGQSLANPTPGHAALPGCWRAKPPDRTPASSTSLFIHCLHSSHGPDTAQVKRTGQRGAWVA